MIYIYIYIDKYISIYIYIYQTKSDVSPHVDPRLRDRVRTRRRELLEDRKRQRGATTAVDFSRLGFLMDFEWTRMMRMGEFQSQNWWMSWNLTMTSVELFFQRSWAGDSKSLDQQGEVPSMVYPKTRLAAKAKPKATRSAKARARLGGRGWKPLRPKKDGHYER